MNNIEQEIKQLTDEEKQKLLEFILAVAEQDT